MQVQVTAIQRTKRGRFSVYLDGEFYCALHADVFATSPLQTGGQVDLDAMEALRRQSEERMARERALKLLGGRSYTEQGLYRKLCEKCDEEAAAAAVARMVELGLVDDADYARRYAADCVNLKGFSRRRTGQELIRKGIDRAIVEETLDKLEDDPEPAIARVIRRKYQGCLGDDKGVQKIMNALARLGYDYGDIRAAVTNLQEDEDYYEE